MDNKKINIYFLICITSRFLLAGFTYIFGNSGDFKGKDELRILFALVLLVISFGFGFNILQDKDVGFFGSKVYWKRSRILHSILYMITAIMLLTGARHNAYILILLDTFYGIGLFSSHYFFSA